MASHGERVIRLDAVYRTWTFGHNSCGRSSLPGHATLRGSACHCKQDLAAVDERCPSKVPSPCLLPEFVAQPTQLQCFEVLQNFCCCFGAWHMTFFCALLDAQVHTGH